MYLRPLYHLPHLTLETQKNSWFTLCRWKFGLTRPLDSYAGMLGPWPLGKYPYLLQYWQERDGEMVREEERKKKGNS